MCEESLNQGLKTTNATNPKLKEGKGMEYYSEFEYSKLDF